MRGGRTPPPGPFLPPGGVPAKPGRGELLATSSSGGGNGKPLDEQPLFVLHP